MHSEEMEQQMALLQSEFSELDFAAIEREQHDSNGNYHRGRGGDIVLRMVCHGFDRQLFLMSAEKYARLVQPPQPPLLPKTRASPAGDVYMGPLSFFRWNHDGTVIEQRIEAGHGWSPRQLVGGL
eukprot:7380397-Prymnesium_polylepis.1